MVNAHEPMLDRVYGALADPTRRSIVAALARGDVTVGGLAGRFPISFNGVSKHVKVLERAGLVERTIQGREHRLRLRAAPLGQAARWLDHYRAFWDARLAALEAWLVDGTMPVVTTRRGRKRSRR
jgi:DNA-binding transcriptional ArsR family regulator